MATTPAASPSPVQTGPRTETQARTKGKGTASTESGAEKGLMCRIR